MYAYGIAPLRAHPVQRGARVETAGKRDADFHWPTGRSCRMRDMGGESRSLKRVILAESFSAERRRAAAGTSAGRYGAPAAECAVARIVRPKNATSLPRNACTGCAGYSTSNACSRRSRRTARTRARWPPCLRRCPTPRFSSSTSRAARLPIRDGGQHLVHTAAYLDSPLLTLRVYPANKSLRDRGFRRAEAPRPVICDRIRGRRIRSALAANAESSNYLR